MRNTPRDVQFYVPKTVAELFSVSLTSVYRWINRGYLDFIKLPGGREYRITAESVERIKRGEFTDKKPAIELRRIKQSEEKDRIALAKLHELERSSK